MIVGVWGPEKGWKTTIALTFPTPLVHFDLDVGGFERAAWRLKDVKTHKCNSNEPIDSVGWGQFDIVSKSYPTPIQIEKLMGQQKTGISIRFPKKVVGIKEVWQSLVVDYVAACQASEVKTMVLDSATQTWFICHRTYLQELQERQLYKYLYDKEGNRIQGRKEEDFPGNEFREKLQPMEYAEPNDRMRTLIYTARSFGKNLVLTHYPRDIYANRVTERGIEEYKTGDIEPDGFKDTQKLVDIVIWVDTDSSGMAHAKITRCGLEGLGTVATGLEIKPSYQGIVELQQSMRGE